MSKKLQWVEIRGNRWLEGNWARENVEESRLLGEEHNRMCCLGFLCRQLVGAKPMEIRDVGTPHAVLEGFNGRDYMDIRRESLLRKAMDDLGLLNYTGRDNSNLTEELTAVNDAFDWELSQTDRVKSLNKVCRKHQAPFRFKLI